MAVMPLVLETKMGERRLTNLSREPIGEKNHVVSAYYVRNFDFVLRFRSLLHDKDCL